MLMPRKHSRITLEATEDAREERLREITDEESIFEGVNNQRLDFTPVMEYAILWNSLHNKPGQRWRDNPRLVRLAFKVREVADAV